MSAARVLVMGCSAGHGHVMAAQAITDQLRRRHPTLDVTQIDMLRMLARWYGKTYRTVYLTMADRAPLAWRALYDWTDKHPAKGGQILSRTAGRGLIRAVKRWQPHVVLATHFLAAEILSGAHKSGKLKASLQIVVTDHDIHRMWYWPGVDRYYVASDLVKARLCIRYGVPAERVFVTGIPVRRPFTEPQEHAEIRARYGLDPRRPIVLYMSGGFAPGPMRQAIMGLWHERRDAQVLAVCGRNERLRRAVARLPRPEGAVLHPLGFVREPWQLISIADLVVTKAGGVTTAECAAMGKPMVVSAAIPGQEERNTDALLEAGAAVRALTPEEIRWRVGRILGDPARLQRMAKASKAFGRPEAAATVADLAAREIEEPVVWGPHFHGARS